MKKIIFYVVALFVIINFLGACKKKKVNYVIEGNVYDETFSKNFSGVTLKIEIKKSGNAYYTHLTDVTTASNGNFTFSIENDLYEKIRITAEPTNYFPIERVISYANLTQEANVYNLSTTAKAWARLIFINNNANPNDQLKYTKQDGKVGCTECCASNEQIITGGSFDTTLCVNNGNTYYSYLYTVVGTSNTGINAVYTSAFDTTDLILNY